MATHIFEKLARYFSERLTDYTNNSYDYLVTLEEFASHMEHIKDEPKRWKTHLAALLYEYIRGAFTFINRNELRDIRKSNSNLADITSKLANGEIRKEDLDEDTVNRLKDVLYN